MLLEGRLFGVLVRESRGFSWSCLPRSCHCCTVGACGCPVIRHGQTSTGRQRWRYKLCQITTLNDIDSTAKHLDEFVAWEALVPTNGDQAQPQGTATEHDADR